MEICIKEYWRNSKEESNKNQNYSFDVGLEDEYRFRGTFHFEFINVDLQRTCRITSINEKRVEKSVRHGKK